MPSRKMTCTEDGSSKFWEGVLDGSSVTTKWGKIGTSGQEKTKDFASPDAAQKEYDKLVKEKLGKGYVDDKPVKGAAKSAPPAKAAPAAKAAAKSAPPAPAKSAPPAAKGGGKKSSHLESHEDGSSKFWVGELDGSDFTTRWGKIGTDGESKTKSFPSPAAAEKEYEKLLKEKLGKGYVKAGDGGEGDEDEDEDEDDDDFGDDEDEDEDD